VINGTCRNAGSVLHCEILSFLLGLDLTLQLAVNGDSGIVHHLLIAVTEGIGDVFAKSCDLREYLRLVLG